jgi:hypothetical protein
MIIAPITNGRLESDLDANDKIIAGPEKISIGNATAGTARLHILPGETPTDDEDGIWIGDDVKLYRGATGQLNIVGNLVVSGTVSAGNAVITLTSTNAWTGPNSFSGTVTATGALYVNNGTAGITFSGASATATRTNLGVDIGSDVQEWSAKLDTIAGLAVTSGSIMVANGSTWTSVSGSSARTAIGLGSSDNVTFAELTTTGDVIFGNAATDTVTLNGKAAFPNATSLTYAVSIGGLTIYNSSGVLTFGSAVSVEALTATGLVSFPNATGSGTGLLFGGDATLYRSASDTLKTDGAFIAAGLTLTGTPLASASGGTGVGTFAQDVMLYASAANTWSVASLSAAVRATLGSADLATFRTAVGFVGANLDTGGIATAKIADGAITSAKIADGTIATGDIADGAITAAKLAAGAVTSAALGSVITAGTYGDASNVPIIQVNAQGQVVAITPTAITAATVAGNYIATLTLGSGLTFTAGAGTGNAAAPTLAVDSTVLAYVTNVMTVPTGKTIAVASGGTLTLAGAATVSSGGTVTVSSGGAVTVASGGTMTLAGAATVSSGGTVTVASGGAVTVASGATMTLAGAATVSSGGAVTVASGATVTLAGAATVSSGGTVAVASGGAVTVASGATMTFSTGATLLIPEATPASASATGVKGTIVWDTSYLYICTATNTWRRIAHATW